MHEAERERSRVRSLGEVLPERIALVLEALEPEGGAVLLLGQPGSGKSRLAEEAANEIERRFSGEVRVVLLPTPLQPDDEDAETFEERFLACFDIVLSQAEAAAGGAREPALLKRMMQSIEREAAGSGAVIVAASIDRYPPRMSTLLAALVRSGTVRLVATAHHHSGAAERVSRDPRVQRIVIGPLTFDEANTMVTRLFGCDEVEFTTMRRWYAITNGYAHSLTVLVFALDRRGLLERERGMLWERTENLGTIPDEFLNHLDEVCTAEELETLGSVAVAEPVTEAVLLERMSPVHLRSLQALGLVVSHEMDSGETAIMTSHPLLANAVRDRMGRAQQQRVSAEMYIALRQNYDQQDLARVPNRLFRMVSLGLAAGRTISVEWLVDSLDSSECDRDPRAKLRIAFAIARHPDVRPARLATAAIVICRTARLLADSESIVRGISVIEELCEPEILHSFPPSLRIGLQLERVNHLTLDREQFEEASAVLDQLEHEDFEPGSAVAEAVRSARVLYLARTGQLRKAFELAPSSGSESRMQLEWAHTSGHLISSLVLAQQGRFAMAAEVAARAHSFAVLGNRRELLIADQLMLAVFISQWCSGALVSARDTMSALHGSSVGRLHETGFVDAGLSLLALGEGKWREAARRAGRAAEHYSHRDPYGVASLLNGAYAFAQAALGERAEARRSLVRAELSRPGTGQSLRGVVRLLALETRLWNEEPDLVEQANKVVTWAAREQLPFIELRALQILATAQKGLDSARLFHARELAAEVDEPMSSALLSFLEDVSSGESVWDAPSARMLTDLGVWVPLPRTPLLSAREREIALHAALGYSSKWIAERFYLSTRTVETHLRHVFTKLGVTGRDELRVHLRQGSFDM